MSGMPISDAVVSGAALDAAESSLRLLREARAELSSADIMPVLLEWLGRRTGIDGHTRARRVRNALRVANQLGYREIEELAPLLLPLTPIIRYRAAVLSLLGQMRFNTMRELVVPYVRAMLEEEDDDAYWDAAVILSHLGLYDELRTVVSRALEHESEDVRETGESIIVRLLPDAYT